MGTDENLESGAVPEPPPPKGGFSGTAEFLASDCDMTTIIFRRFHTASVRNLLWLEGRVAALERHQQTLDYLAQNKSTGLEKYLGSSASPLPDVERAAKSWEGLCVLGRSGDGSGDTSGDSLSIPPSALREWEERYHVGKQESAMRILGLSSEGTSAPSEQQQLSSEEMKKKTDPGQDITSETQQTAKEKKPGAANIEVKEDKSVSTDPTALKVASALIKAQWETSVAMNAAMKEYQEAILRYRDVMNIAPPANRTFQAVQNWFRPRAESSKREAPFMDKSVLDTLFLNNTDGTKFPYESETMTLHAPAEEDRFSRWIVQWGVLGSFFRLKHPASDEFSVVKEKIIHRIVTFSTMLSALIFLVVAVWVLWILRKAEATVRLGVVTAFVVVFAAFLALFTSAKRSDIFATTAAYAAVLVVFLSQGENASTQLAPSS